MYARKQGKFTSLHFTTHSNYRTFTISIIIIMMMIIIIIIIIIIMIIELND